MVETKSVVGIALQPYMFEAVWAIMVSLPVNNIAVQVPPAPPALALVAMAKTSGRMVVLTAASPAVVLITRKLSMEQFAFNFIVATPRLATQISAALAPPTITTHHVPNAPVVVVVL